MNASSWQLRELLTQTLGVKFRPRTLRVLKNSIRNRANPREDKATRWRGGPRGATPGSGRPPALCGPASPGARRGGPSGGAGPGRAALSHPAPPRPRGTGPRRGAAAARRSPGPAAGPVGRPPPPARRGWPRRARPYLRAARRGGDLAGRTTAAAGGGGRPGPARPCSRCSAPPGREAKSAAEGPPLHRHGALAWGRGGGCRQRPPSPRQARLGARAGRFENWHSQR